MDKETTHSHTHVLEHTDTQFSHEGKCNNDHIFFFSYMESGNGGRGKVQMIEDMRKGARQGKREGDRGMERKR